MINFEYFIAYEHNNPANLFFYKPLKIETNFIKAKILDKGQINLEREYHLYLNIGGVNFSFLVQPLKKDNDEVVFLVKDSKIELRKYPRLKTEGLNISVSSDGIEGKLDDISLGGCRIKVEEGLVELFVKKNALKTLSITLPNGKNFKVKAYVVNVHPQKKFISFSFPQKNSEVLRLYTSIVELLRRSGYEGELPTKVEGV